MRIRKQKEFAGTNGTEHSKAVEDTWKMEEGCPNIKRKVERVNLKGIRVKELRSSVFQE